MTYFDTKSVIESRMTRKMNFWEQSESCPRILTTSIFDYLLCGNLVKCLGISLTFNALLSLYQGHKDHVAVSKGNGIP